VSELKKFLRGKEFPERGPNFLNLCPIVLNYFQNIFPRAAKNFPAPLGLQLFSVYIAPQNLIKILHEITVNSQG